MKYPTLQELEYQMTSSLAEKISAFEEGFYENERFNKERIKKFDAACAQLEAMRLQIKEMSRTFGRAHKKDKPKLVPALVDVLRTFGIAYREVTEKFNTCNRQFLIEDLEWDNRSELERSRQSIIIQIELMKDLGFYVEHLESRFLSTDKWSR